MLKPKCKNYRTYKGKRAPKCNGGVGCLACWAKYKAEQDKGVYGTAVKDFLALDADAQREVLSN